MRAVETSAELPASGFHTSPGTRTPQNESAATTNPTSDAIQKALAISVAESVARDGSSQPRGSRPAAHLGPGAQADPDQGSQRPAMPEPTDQHYASDHRSEHRLVAELSRIFMACLLPGPDMGCDDRQERRLRACEGLASEPPRAIGAWATVPLALARPPVVPDPHMDDARRSGQWSNGWRLRLGCSSRRTSA
jgi:hypothetical protein